MDFELVRRWGGVTVGMAEDMLLSIYILLLWGSKVPVRVQYSGSGFKKRRTHFGDLLDEIEKAKDDADWTGSELEGEI